MLWRKKIACRINEQRMLHVSCFQPLLPPQTVDPEGIQDAEKQATGSRWLRCIQRNDCSKPGLVHLPIEGKALNLLT